MSKREESVMGCVFGVIAFAFVMAISFVLAAFYAWAFTWLWYWFVAYVFNVPMITMAQAYGLMLVTNFALLGVATKLDITSLGNKLSLKLEKDSEVEILTQFKDAVVNMFSPLWVVILYLFIGYFVFMNFIFTGAKSLGHF